MSRPWLAALACFLAACQSPSPPPPWQVVTTDASGWMLAVEATADRVYVVGGQPGQGPGLPGQGVVTVVRGVDPAVVQKQNSPQPGMLWWIHALPGGVAWLAGENGSVLRYDESSPDPNTGLPQLLAITTATKATLYGVWAFSDDDVWAVGGDDGQPGVILHGGRGGLTIDTTAPTVANLFKVYAADSDHLFVVGASGVLLRRSGGVWTRDPSPSTDRLLTAWGTSATDVYAVGGLGAAAAVHWDGSSWSALTVTDLDPLAGLTVAENEVLVGGQRGFLATRAQDAADSQPWLVADPVTTLDLHAVCAFESTRFAVGGNLSQYQLQPPQGVLLQQGMPVRNVAP